MILLWSVPCPVSVGGEEGGRKLDQPEFWEILLGLILGPK